MYCADWFCERKLRPLNLPKTRWKQSDRRQFDRLDPLRLQFDFIQLFIFRQIRFWGGISFRNLEN